MAEILTLLIGMSLLMVLAFLLSGYDFYSPSFIISLLFTFSAVLALYAVVSWEVPGSFFSFRATWIMFSGTLMFLFFEHLVRYLTLSKKQDFSLNYKEVTPIHVSLPRMWIVICLGALGTALYVYGIYNKVRVNGYSGGFVVSDIASFNHKLSFSNEIKGGIGRAVRIMQDVNRASMYICMYIFLNNVVGCREKLRKNFIYILPVLTWFPNIMITSSRGSYLQLAGACVFYFYILLCRKSRWSKMKQNYRKIIRYAAASFIVVLGIFYVAVLNGAIGRKTNKNLIDYITTYLGAPIIHFHQFITSPPADVTYYGQETFNKFFPVFKRFGLIEGTFSGQMEVRRIVGTYSGNVYTFFRRPLHDFGLVGMYVIVAFTAIVFSYIYYKRIYGKYQSYKNDLILILYSYFFYIIYIFSIDNAIYLYAYFGILYFLIVICTMYAFLLGKLRFGFRRY